jgi:hypothetical protein
MQAGSEMLPTVTGPENMFITPMMTAMMVKQGSASPVYACGVR